MTIYTADFWKASFERAVKTFAQTAAALAVGSGTGLIDADWVPLASVSGMAALVSLLSSVGSDALTGDGPSLTNAESLPVDYTPRILGKAFVSTFSKEAEDARDPHRP